MLFPESMPAPVMRRLAEAADGNRTGQDIYFLANPRNLVTVFPVTDPDEVDGIIREKDLVGYELFGPFNTPPDAHPLPLVEQVILRYADGQEKRYHGSEVDALFLTRAALDKFYYPYEVGVLGIDTTSRMRIGECVIHDWHTNPM